MRWTRKCPICGKKFETDHNGQKYCSEECAHTAHTAQCHEYYLLQQKEVAISTIEPDELEYCLSCGKAFSRRECNMNTKFCCNTCYKEYRKKRPKPAKSGKTMADWTREARECNLDYGTYRGLIAMGKTYEELKEQAAQRVERVHQRRSAPREGINHGRVLG